MQKLQANDKQDLRKVDIELKKELGLRDRLFNPARLRKTVIKGLPCEYIEFKKIIIPPT